jgi:O-antigen/teichoic acid export membrane protein
MVNGVAAYAFIMLASRDLGPEAYTPVGLLWALSFLLGPGFFQPLEQEVARIVAARSDGRVGPVVRTAAAIGAGMVGLLVVFALILGDRIRHDLFDGHGLLVVGLLLVLVGLGIGHLVRGVLAGLGRFGGYARYFIGDGVGRLVMVLVLAATVGGVGAYGLAVGLAPFIGVALALAGQRELSLKGPAEPVGGLSRALGALLVASVATALVLNVSPLAVEVLAGPDQAEEPGRFLNALLIARVPLFFFQAVQASLLPRLSALVSVGRFDEMVHVFRRLLGLVVGIGGVAILVCAAIGTRIVEFAFGADFAVERRDMVLLAASSAVLMVALSFAQALMACRAQGRMATAWVLGLVAFPVVVALGDDLFLRVELGLLATVSVAALSMATLLVERLRSTERWAIS